QGSGMLSFDCADLGADGPPSWWSGHLQSGHAVELVVYGEQMVGRLREIAGDTLTITVPVEGQVSGLRLSTAAGTAVLAMEGGAARFPVSCWASGEIVRLRVVGPVEFIQRRAHVRVERRLPITLGWLQPGQRTWDHVKSFTVDISAGGLQVEPVTTVWPS